MLLCGPHPILTTHTPKLTHTQETVDLVEEIAMQYITDTVHAAMRAAAVRTAGANT